MKLPCHRFPLLAMAVLLCSDPAEGRAGEEPSAFWAQSLGAWFNPERANFSAHVLMGPDNLPIGVSFQLVNPLAILRENSQIGQEGLRPCCFQGIGWTLRDDLGYSARLVLGPDLGVVGILFRVWNNSQTAPLVLTRQKGALPFQCQISSYNENNGCIEPLSRRGEHQRLDWKERTGIDWILPPRTKEETFVHIRELLPSQFEPTQEVYIEIRMNVIPKRNDQSGTKWNRNALHPWLLPHFNGAGQITDVSLKTDGESALKQAKEMQPNP